jgi:pyroglutamyl-peptidase
VARQAVTLELSMRLLIYGFGPYRHFQRNITEKILRQLPKRRSIKKIVFPVKFHKAQFTNVVEQFNPEVIVGMGQCSRGRFLRIEQRAVNKKRNGKREKGRAIVAGGAGTLLTNLKFDLGREARVSRNAGDYVCNFSMYVMLDCLRRRRQTVPFGFIHIPHGYNEKKATRLLAKAINNLSRQTIRSKSLILVGLSL